ncbi:ead/Ea22-like family protein [Salmonella enterica subsp. enterica serovar O rough]|nr:ead/Ea22-like family protein [Salmonella enterica subsp. enterica serovar O rough]
MGGSPMTALNKHADLRQLAEKATHGEWWSDVVETEGEYGDGEDRASGYHSYAVYVGSESLLDMTNSTAACIHEEWDHDYRMAWDETAKRNAEFIAAANPAVVLALLDELEAAEKRIEEGICRANREHHRGFMMACNHLKEHANIHYADAAEMEIAALRQRIAELEARTVNLPAACADDEYFIDGVFQALRYERDVERAIRAAGIGVKGE